MSLRKLLLIFVLLFTPKFTAAVPETEEGMFPLSEIKKIDLLKAGLQIDPSMIYNTDGESLIDALVQLSGCSGSFVSGEGLILTNHHCGFGSIAKVSTTEINYLEDGFRALSKEEEIPIPDYKAKITLSYEDISELILNYVKDTDDPAERSKMISKKMRETAKLYFDDENSIEAEVAEMFAGQTYILFRYKIIKDIRLVFAPPRMIGEFGGETDNWVWPRHTGDFAFFRAYVAPDGNSAEYAEENIPYKPVKYLRVNPSGVKEDDFVFILGYPGRTFRNYPSQYLEYQQRYLLPYVHDLYSWVIDLYDIISTDNDDLKLRYASTVKSLSNTQKNYGSKLKGLRRLDLVNKKKDEDRELQNFLNSSPHLLQKYSNLFSEIENVYAANNRIAEADLWFARFYVLSNYFKIGSFIVEHAYQKGLPEEERDSRFKQENITKTLGAADSYFKNFNGDFEEALWYKMIIDAAGFNENSRISILDKIFDAEIDGDAVEEYVNILLYEDGLADKNLFDELLAKSYSQLERLNNPAIQFFIQLHKQHKTLKDENDKINGRLSSLLPSYYELKRQWKNTDFIPDANRTIRFTYGYIKGYSPADAVYYSPITSINGLIEKSYSNNEDYRIPDVMYNLHKNKNFGNYVDENLNTLPVAILYNLDTTGGNSGSPVLNAKGELIGLNFDRAYEATINDFAWNESYSRSIGVDIRYVLWVTDILGGADNIIKELGVK